MKGRMIPDAIEITGDWEKEKERGKEVAQIVLFMIVVPVFVLGVSRNDVLCVQSFYSRRGSIVPFVLMEVE